MLIGYLDMAANYFTSSGYDKSRNKRYVLHLYGEIYTTVTESY